MRQRHHQSCGYRITNHQSPSVADRTPINARIRGTIEHAVVYHDGLGASPRFHLPHLSYGVAARGEFCHRLCRKPSLHPQLRCRQEVRGIRAGEAEPPWPFNRLLNRKPTVCDIAEYLRVPLRLPISAWCPPGQVRRALPERHERHERVHGALAWPNAVRMIFIQDETAPGPVVQQNSGPFYDLAAAETSGEAGDVRHDVALRVGSPEVRRVADSLCEQPRRDLGPGAPGIDDAPPARSVVL